MRTFLPLVEKCVAVLIEPGSHQSPLRSVSCWMGFRSTQIRHQAPWCGWCLCPMLIFSFLVGLEPGTAAAVEVGCWKSKFLLQMSASGSWYACLLTYTQWTVVHLYGYPHHLSCNMASQPKSHCDPPYQHWASGGTLAQCRTAWIRVVSVEVGNRFRDMLEGCQWRSPQDSWNTHTRNEQPMHPNAHSHSQQPRQQEQLLQHEFKHEGHST